MLPLDRFLHFRTRPLMLLAWACLLLVVLPACVDTGAVRDFAKLSASVAATKDVAQLGPESIERSIGFALEPDQAAALNQTLEDAKRNAERTIALQRVVVEYMKAIGHLADDELIGFDSELLALSDAAAGVGAFRDEQTAQATRSIAQLIARAATDAYRRGKLAEVITQADEPLQHVLQTLITLAERGSLGLLNDETAAAKLSYGLREAQAGDGLAEPPAKALRSLLSESRAEHEKAQAARREVVRAYAASLREVQAAHAMLAQDAANATGKELSAWLRPYLARIETLHTELADARIKAK